MSTRRIRGVAEGGPDGWIYAKIGGMAEVFCSFVGLMLLVWVVLRLAMLMLWVDGPG